MKKGAIKLSVLLMLAATPFITKAQQQPDTLTFYRFNDRVGIVIDVSEKKQCQCIPYVSDSEFEFAVLQKLDSTIVLNIKTLSRPELQEVIMYQPRLESLAGLIKNMPDSSGAADSIAEINTIREVFAKKGFIKIEALYLPALINHIGGKNPDPRPVIYSAYQTVQQGYTQKDPRILFGAGLGVSSFGRGSRLSVYFIARSGLGFGLSRTAAFSSPENEPKDYYCTALWFSETCDPPSDKFYSTNLYVVKSIKTDDPFFSISFAGFAAILNKKTVEFIPGTGGLSNYNTYYDIEKAMGGGLRAMFDLNFSRVVGLQLAVEGNLNSIKSVIGIELVLHFGIVRDRLN